MESIPKDRDKTDLLIQIKNGIQMLLKKHRKFYIFVFLHGIKGFFLHFREYVR